jgi:hypothetical protein
MRFRSREPIVPPGRFRSVEDASEAETADVDASGPAGIAQAEKDYSGRTDDEEDGAIPAEPPDHETARLHPIKKPGVPEHNM